MITLDFQDLGSPSRIPWFAKQWRAPLNRCIYTAFSYTVFLVCITMYVAEIQPPGEHWLDVLTSIWIVSYTCRDMGTGEPSYLFSGQSYKTITLVNYDSRVLIWGIFKSGMTLES